MNAAVDVENSVELTDSCSILPVFLATTRIPTTYRLRSQASDRVHLGLHVTLHPLWHYYNPRDTLVTISLSADGHIDADNEHLKSNEHQKRSSCEEHNQSRSLHLIGRILLSQDLSTEAIISSYSKWSEVVQMNFFPTFATTNTLKVFGQFGNPQTVAKDNRTLLIQCRSIIFAGLAVSPIYAFHGSTR